MPDLFGLDIAGLVNEALSSAGGLVQGSFVRKTLTGTRTTPTGGQGSTTVTHTFQGFFENLTAARREGSLIREPGQYVSILGASIVPPVEPYPGIVISLEGKTLTAIELTSRDPAAAMYTFKVSP